MNIKHLQDCPPFISGDGCMIRELANAATEDRAFRYSFAEARVAAGEKTQPHALATSEVYYILQGTGRMHIDDESATVGAGDFIDIPPKARQWIENIGEEELVFICIVDPGWRKADEVVF